MGHVCDAWRRTIEPLPTSEENENEAFRDRATGEEWYLDLEEEYEDVSAGREEHLVVDDQGTYDAAVGEER